MNDLSSFTQYRNINLGYLPVWIIWDHTHSGDVDVTKYPPKYHKVINTQHSIGWRHFLAGKISQEWLRLQLTSNSKIYGHERERVLCMWSVNRRTHSTVIDRKYKITYWINYSHFLFFPFLIDLSWSFFLFFLSFLFFFLSLFRRSTS